ncbi:MAG: hypothetical protein KF749_02595 [Bacteroidetes bacterium]|nr:hypothetical protein [Bacteroidota bacterium]
MLSTIVDGAILVASAEDPMPAIYRATGSLTNVGGKVLGVLLNNFDVKKAYGGYYGSYGYSYYAHNYGYYHSNGNGESPKKKRKKTVGS